MKKLLVSLAMVAIVLPVTWAQDDYDDIYYNPNEKEKTEKKKSNYISNFS